MARRHEGEEIEIRRRPSGAARREERGEGEPAVNPLSLVPDALQEDPDPQTIYKERMAEFQTQAALWMDLGITSGQLPALPAKPAAMLAPPPQITPPAPAKRLPEIDPMTPRLAQEMASEIPRFDVPGQDAPHIVKVAEALVDYARRHEGESLHLAIELALRRLDDLRLAGAYRGVVSHADAVAMQSHGIGQGGTTRLLCMRTKGKTLFGRRSIVSEICALEVQGGFWVGFALEAGRLVEIENKRPARFNMKLSMQNRGYRVLEGWPTPATPPRFTWQLTQVSRVLARLGYNAHLVRTFEGVEAFFCIDHADTVERKKKLLEGALFWPRLKKKAKTILRKVWLASWPFAVVLLIIILVASIYGAAYEARY